MLTLLCRIKIKSDIFKVDGKTSFYIIFYFKIMSQLWDTCFNEGGRHQSNTSVSVFFLSVNFDDNGSDLFIFQPPISSCLVFSMPKDMGFGALWRGFSWNHRYVHLRNIFEIENNCGREPGEAHPMQHCFELTTREANYESQIFVMNGVFKVCMRKFRNQL